MTPKLMSQTVPSIKLETLHALCDNEAANKQTTGHVTVDRHL